MSCSPGRFVVLGPGRRLIAVSRTGYGKLASVKVASDAGSGFGPLLANRSFMWMWIGQCFSQVADKLVFILLVELVSELTPSARVMSLALALHTAPNVLLGALAGVWVDRRDKRRVMMASNLLRAILVVALGFLGQTHVAVAMALAFLIASAAQPFIPAEAAAMPLVVPREHLMQANSIFTTTLVGSIVVGFTLGEPLVHWAGTQGAAWVVGAGFLLSVGFLKYVRYTQPAEVAPRHETYREQFRQGLAYIRTRGGIRRTLTFQVMIFAMFAAMSVLAILFAKGVLKTNFSWFLAAAGVGLAVGAWLLGHLGSRINRDAAIAGGFFATGTVLAALSGLGPSQKFLAFGLAGVLGFTAAWVAVPLQTRLQELVDEQMRGKVFGVQNMLLNLAATIPLGAVGFVVEGVGVAPVLLALGGVMALAGLGALRAPLGQPSPP